MHVHVHVCSENPPLCYITVTLVTPGNSLQRKKDIKCGTLLHSYAI